MSGEKNEKVSQDFRALGRAAVTERAAAQLAELAEKGHGVLGERGERAVGLPDDSRAGLEGLLGDDLDVAGAGVADGEQRLGDEPDPQAGGGAGAGSRSAGSGRAPAPPGRR